MCSLSAGGGWCCCCWCVHVRLLLPPLLLVVLVVVGEPGSELWHSPTPAQLQSPSAQTGEPARWKAAQPAAAAAAAVAASSSSSSRSGASAALCVHQALTLLHRLCPRSSGRCRCSSLATGAAAAATAEGISSSSDRAARHGLGSSAQCKSVRRAAAGAARAAGEQTPEGLLPKGCGGARPGRPGPGSQGSGSR